MLERLREILLGAPKNLLDPRIHQHLALIAFFAWVGLGSDGLSSSAYGPEETFLHLGDHRYLAIFLVLALVGTVFLIAASYTQIIELFPTGGGGYLVATKLLGPTPGAIAGGALVVDYVLTIAISAASGCDAIFSFLPVGWQIFKLPTGIFVIAMLTTMNARGVKESVVILIPIFMGFMITHVGLILYGVLTSAGHLVPVVVDSVEQTTKNVESLGLFTVLLIFFRAYSLGGGTYTGIEAVSNSTDILRDPKVQTGKKTTTYMAISLAFTAGGILLCYLLNNLQAEEGRTLNAVLWSHLTNGWVIGDFELGPALVMLTLITEGALLFVAAQTGFVAGPRTLASMSLDHWVPKRFAHLSERLVTQNGIITMGAAAALVMLYTRGSVAILVVMYSINVFIAFTLTQAGMAKHWWTTREAQDHWRRRFVIATVGTIVCGSILTLTSILKFKEGVGVSLIVTGVFIVVCFIVRSHYGRVRELLSSLDDALTNLPLTQEKSRTELAPDGPTAIVLVESFRGLGIHTLLSIQRLFPKHYKNFVFCSVGRVDSGRFKGVREIKALEESVRRDLEKYVQLAQRMGFYAEYRYVLGTDLIEELEHMCLDLMREFRRSVVFAGQLVFQRENFLTRSLHTETAFLIQRRLQFSGVQVIILPIRVWEKPREAA